MSFVVLALYITLTLLSPADLIPELSPYRPVMILSGIAVVIVLSGFLIQRDRFVTKESALMALVYLSLLCSWPLHGWLGGAILTAQLYTTLPVTFFIVLTGSSSVGRLRWLAYTIIGVAVYYAVRVVLAFDFNIAAERFIMQQTGGWDAVTEQSTSISRGIGRGILQDPNDLGQLLLVAGSFLVLLWRRAGPIQRFFAAVAAFILLYGIYLTKSRGTLVGLFVLAALIFKEKVGLAGPLVGGAFVALLIMLGGFGGGRAMSFGSGGDRLELWSDALSLIKTYPLRGIGVNNIMDYMENTVHNSFLLAHVEMGLLGYPFWLGLVIVAALHVWRVAKFLKDRGLQATPHYALTRAVLLALGAFLSTCWFLSRTYSLLLYIVLGMGAALWVITKREYPELEDYTWMRIVVYTCSGIVGIFMAAYVLVRLHWG